MMRLVVSDHALQRAQQRYGLATVDRRLIFDDVVAAMLARRGGKEHPTGFGYVTPSGRIFVWTPGRERIYVVESVRTRRRVYLRVVTALPGDRGTDHLGSVSLARRRAA